MNEVKKKFMIYDKLLSKKVFNVYYLKRNESLPII